MDAVTAWCQRKAEEEVVERWELLVTALAEWLQRRHARSHAQWLRCVRAVQEAMNSSLTAAASGAPSASASCAPSFVRDFHGGGDDREELSDFWRIGPERFWKRPS